MVALLSMCLLCLRWESVRIGWRWNGVFSYCSTLRPAHPLSPLHTLCTTLESQNTWLSVLFYQSLAIFPNNLSGHLIGPRLTNTAASLPLTGRSQGRRHTMVCRAHTDERHSWQSSQPAPFLTFGAGSAMQGLARFPEVLYINFGEPIR